MLINEIIKKYWYKIKKILLYPYNMYSSIKLTEEINANIGEDINAVIILMKGIGDTVYGLSYIKKVIDQAGEVLVIGNKDMRFLVEAYSEKIKFLPYSVSENNYSKYQKYFDCERIRSIRTSYCLYNTDPYHVYSHKTRDSENTAIELLKRKVFKAEEKCPITYPPLISYEVESIADFNNISSHVIIMNPYSNSISSVSVEVYEQMAKMLLDEGFVVYTNDISGREIVNGTLRLSCTIMELSVIMQHIAGIVSIRSGILDLAVNTGTSMFVMYSNCTKKFREIYSLSAWNGKSKITEVDYDNISAADFFQLFSNWYNNFDREPNY